MLLTGWEIACLVALDVAGAGDVGLLIPEAIVDPIIQQLLDAGFVNDEGDLTRLGRVVVDGVGKTYGNRESRNGVVA